MAGNQLMERTLPRCALRHSAKTSVIRSRSWRPISLGLISWEVTGDEGHEIAALPITNEVCALADLMWELGDMAARAPATSARF